MKRMDLTAFKIAQLLVSVTKKTWDQVGGVRLRVEGLRFSFDVGEANAQKQ